MKKLKIFFLVLFLSIVLSACGQKDDVLVMDRPAEDGKYHYSNKDLEFSLTLPEEFIYYQTQRKLTKEYTDIEFFVPTGDKKYNQEVPGYAKPIVLRVYSDENWEENMKNDPYSDFFEVLDNKKDKVYVVRFWQSIPLDWQEKWSEEMKNKIKESFKIN